MYDIKDNRSAVKALQRYLSKIYGKEKSINQNGIFDNNTLTALNRYQAENGLDIKNYADFQSFDSIYNAYLEELIRDESRKSDPDISFPLKRGDQSASVARLNTMLKDILDHYSIYSYGLHNDYFSSYTEESVKILREILNFEVGENVDELLYSRIASEWRSISKIKAE